MSKMRKSLAVLSAAVVPVIYFSAPSLAGVTTVVSVPNASLSTTATWPNSPTFNNPSVINSFNPNVPGFGPNGRPQDSTVGVGITPGATAGQSFTTGSSGFVLGAISVAISSGPDTGGTGNTLSLHLFQLGNGYVPLGGPLTLGPSGTGTEVSPDLLGGGNGLNFQFAAGGAAAEVLEFDFNSTGTNDLVPLAPNTSYYFELWNTSTDSGAGTVFLQRSGSNDPYAGGQEYASTSTGPAVQTAFSTSTRTIASSGAPRSVGFAVYNVTIPGAPFWFSTSSGSWDAASNWSSATVPDGIGAEADFLSAASTFNTPPAKTGLSSNGNVFTDTAHTVGTMNFDNSNTYVLDGNGSLTLQVASGNAAVNVLSGNQKINLPLTVASNTVFNIASGATLRISDPITINAGISLTKTGSGTVSYESTINVLSGGVINFASPTTVQSLALTGSAQAVVANHGTGVVNTLQLDSLSTDAGSKVDLTNNALVLHGGSLASVATQLSTVQAALKNGFNAHAGYWNGTNGIVSSSAAADTSHLTTLGYMQSNGGTFNGVATTTNDVLVKYTYYGDANLDGVVNGADYQQIDMGFGTGGTQWSAGDFNYDGVVNGSDFALIDNTFNQLTASGAGSLALVSSPLAEVGAGVSAVPEPTSLGLLGIGALSLLRRRRIKI